MKGLYSGFRVRNNIHHLATAQWHHIRSLI